MIGWDRVNGQVLHAHANHLQEHRAWKHRCTLSTVSCRRLSTMRPSCQHSVQSPQRFAWLLPPPLPLLPPLLALAAPAPPLSAFECCCTSSADSSARSAAYKHGWQCGRQAEPAGGMSSAFTSSDNPM